MNWKPCVWNNLKECPKNASKTFLLVSFFSKRLVRSTNQAYSSDFYFRIAWQSTERPCFLQNISLSVLQGLRSLKNFNSSLNNGNFGALIFQDFKILKIIPLIFTQFWSRSLLNKLDRSTPKVVYSIVILPHERKKKTVKYQSTYKKECCPLTNFIKANLSNPCFFF